jgi:hypothetical protein
MLSHRAMATGRAAHARTVYRIVIAREDNMLMLCNNDIVSYMLISMLMLYINDIASCMLMLYHNDVASCMLML